VREWDEEHVREMTESRGMQTAWGQAMHAAHACCPHVVRMSASYIEQLRRLRRGGAMVTNGVQLLPLQGELCRVDRQGQQAAAAAIRCIQ
jgi:hypothetical protein